MSHKAFLCIHFLILIPQNLTRASGVVIFVHDWTSSEKGLARTVDLVCSGLGNQRWTGLPWGGDPRPSHSCYEDFGNALVPVKFTAMGKPSFKTLFFVVGGRGG